MATIEQIEELEKQGHDTVQDVKAEAEGRIEYVHISAYCSKCEFLARRYRAGF